MYNFGPIIVRSFRTVRSLGTYKSYPKMYKRCGRYDFEVTYPSKPLDLGNVIDVTSEKV